MGGKRLNSVTYPTNSLYSSRINKLAAKTQERQDQYSFTVRKEEETENLNLGLSPEPRKLSKAIPAPLPTG